MKRILFAISSLAIFAGIAMSCQKEVSPLQDDVNLISKFTITATIADSGTKVSYAEDGSTHALKPSWQAYKDIIIGFDEFGETYGFNATAVDASGSATFELLTSGTYAGTATSAPADGTKMYMFYAPGKKPSDISDMTFADDIDSQSRTVSDINFTYSLASQSKSVLPALMIASGTVTSGSLVLSFENQCAIIAIKNPTMAAAGKSYTSISLSGSKVYTEVKFNLDGGNLKATYEAPGMITKAISFTSDETTKKSPENTVVYIAACPAGSSTTPTTVYLTTNNLEGKTKSGIYMEAGHYYYMSPTFTNTNLLPGVFSVSDTKMVRFTKGNLYYSTSDNAYHIEAAQNVVYGSRTEEYDSTHVYHFYWSNITDWQTSGKEPWKLDYSCSHQVTSDKFFCGEDNKMVVDGIEGLYALTGGENGEWNYLFKSRKNASSLYKFGVKVTTSTSLVQKYVVIAPDSYTGTIEESYTADELANAEAAGLVCLPAAGFRSGIQQRSGWGEGYYWSATPSELNNTYACVLNFDNSDADPAATTYRNRACSVRLVNNAQ